MGQFERRALEAEVVPGGVGQDESKVNVNDVALRVHQNVTIVSVMDMYAETGGQEIRTLVELNLSETRYICTYIQYLPL